MDDKSGEFHEMATPDLAAALRRARVESAERFEAVGALRDAEIARLQALEALVSPVIGRSPLGADLFDAGIAYGGRPRLFIDMIGFVEMAHDRRGYRFFQDTRHGRMLLAESAALEPMATAVTDYVARRLVERERALASDRRDREIGAPGAAPPRSRLEAAGDAFHFVLLTLGAIAFLLLAGAGAFAAWALWLRPLWEGWIGPPPF